MHFTLSNFNQNGPGLFIAGCAFVCIGLLTWSFSSHRHEFIRCFANHENVRDLARSLPRKNDFKKAMRTMGMLQLAIGGITTVAGWLQWHSVPISNVVDILFTRTWWNYNTERDAFSELYHWINLIEGCFWMGFAVLVVRRHFAHEHELNERRIEWLYAFAFITFALSDFLEAWQVQSWLILFKGVNLIVLLGIRHVVISRYYPNSKTY